MNSPTPFSPLSVADRSAQLLRQQQLQIWSHTHRTFIGLLLVQWVAGVLLAAYLSPFTWTGTSRAIHPHVWEALVLGLLNLVGPYLCQKRWPEAALTRHVIAASQMLSSALIIHLGGGRIEMHFHVFGSLAFLAFYRDWRVLITATVVVGIDHWARGVFFPMSVFGTAIAQNWRWVEHAVWVVFENIFLIASCRRSTRQMADNAHQQALLEENNRTVEQKVQERTAELEALQQEMLKVARSAGMADVATSVLHNVGNVLNSVNISVDVATKKLQGAPLNNLKRALDLMAAHPADLGAFLEQDPKGKQIPGYLRSVSDVLSAEQSALLEEMRLLAKNVDHIKEIVHLQQSNAKGKDGVLERVHLPALIDDALRVTFSAADRQRLTVSAEGPALPNVVTDKHTLLQILINLASNARQAVLASPNPQPAVRVTWQLSADNQIRINIADTGVGIPPENLQRIFNHGFTTKKDGHGFGLHSAANAAKKLGGALSASSDGPGRGAVFTLQLPATKAPVTQ